MAILGHVAVDGTKINTNASKHEAMSYGRMKKERERLRKQIREYLEGCVALDEEEDELYGADKRGDELPEQLADPVRRLDKIEEPMAVLEEEAQQEAEEKGKGNGDPPDGGRGTSPSADAGYWVTKDVEAVDWYDIEPVVAPRKIRHIFSMPELPARALSSAYRCQRLWRVGQGEGPR